MNLLALAPAWLLIVLSAAVVAAAIEDMIRFKISNLTVLVVIAAAAAGAALRGFDLSLWQNVAVFLLFLAVGTAMFAAGMLGGGDVKLFAAIGLWIDFERAIIFVAAVFLAGGFIAVAILSSRLFVRPAGKAKIKAQSKRIPYGVAIALGALCTIALQHQVAGAGHPNPRQFHSIGLGGI